VRVKHAFFSEMGEELPSLDQLQHDIDILLILGDGLEVDLSRMEGTMNGCEMDRRMVY